MEEYRPRRSPAGERFIGMFSSPSPSSSPTEPSFVAGDELHEDDFLFSSTDVPPQLDWPRSPGRGVTQGHLGLLAALALHEGDMRLLVRGGGGGGGAAAAAANAGTLLRRKATIAAAAASASAASGSGSSLSPTQSPTSSARAIPATAKPKNAGPAPPYHQSAPVKVPVRPPRKPAMGRWGEFDDDDDDFRRGDAAMLPPHEMVARASAGGAGPAAPFSMLEGAGRTLKGRDLRRVRDAVLRQTGFLD
ncbi:protein S40-7-like [Phragmites australis]|uniref:protein S40-7-like n=1 Tax=Phragmites australis TaxID=29695 RepID=UPI002D7A0210|nr:protein S40-7-like [Phragmites australis]